MRPGISLMRECTLSDMQIGLIMLRRPHKGGGGGVSWLSCCAGACSVKGRQCLISSSEIAKETCV